MLTKKTVENAIKNLYGFDVELVKGVGYYYFDASDGSLDTLKSTSVMVNRLNQMTLVQWVNAFDELVVEDV